MARGGDAGSGRGAQQLVRGACLGRRAPCSAAGCLSGGAISPQGIFVTFEGLDFSGKSTLVRSLRSLLSEAEPPVYFTREPGGTPAAERIREVLLDPGVDMDAWTEAYLYAAARADHARREILPRLERGETVFCERYLDSSLAYQGSGRGLGLRVVREINAFAVGAIVPDRTFYMQLDTAERDRRAREIGVPLDRLELVGAEFMQRVERGFEELARLEPERIKVLSAARPTHELAEIVLRELRSLQYTRKNGEWDLEDSDGPRSGG